MLIKVSDVIVKKTDDWKDIVIHKYKSVNNQSGT